MGRAYVSGREKTTRERHFGERLNASHKHDCEAAGTFFGVQVSGASAAGGRSGLRTRHALLAERWGCFTESAWRGSVKVEEGMSDVGQKKQIRAWRQARGYGIMLYALG